jgi:hypoxanthine-DNA glycosylase
MTIKYCLPPVVDESTRLLILGSLPGEQSLAQAQYYAHRQNRFWHLIGEVIGVDLTKLDYSTRLAHLLQHHVGMWDVVASANRAGSLDSRIRNHTGNNIAGLIQSLPCLRTIAFNGGTAAKHGVTQLGAIADQYQIVRLPSSSPAYTLPYDQKRQAWLVLSDFL